ncbi:MAG: FAD-dependent oxidoreductase [Balneolaceae bacterium]
MKIGIIGAGIAGLAAGKELSLAGNEVTIIEKNREAGGRLATFAGGGNTLSKFDYGISYFTADTPAFRGFVSELLEKELLKIWGDNIWQYDGNKLLQINPDSLGHPKYAAPEGLGGIGKYLSRWSDITTAQPAGGLTYLGANRGRKRAWMVNLTNFNTFEADAVIVATPAPEAYGILLTAQDEIETMKLIREIDEINYDPAYVLMADYGDILPPEWDAVLCNDPVIRFVTNENSKRQDLPGTALVIQATGDFSRSHREEAPQVVSEKILRHLQTIAGEWSAAPKWQHLHFWKFFRPRSVINRPFMETAFDDAPLAVVGDYFEGNQLDSAYSSGLKLARHWIEKFKDE